MLELFTVTKKSRVKSQKSRVKSRENFLTHGFQLSTPDS